MSNKFNLSIFIEKAKSIYNDKYDFTKSTYNKESKKIRVFCKKHGFFEEKLYLFFKSNECKKCKPRPRNKNLSNKEFIGKSKNIFGELFSYNLVDYQGTKSEVTIICRKHGPFLVTPHYHLSKGSRGGCKHCALINKKRKNTVYDFIEKANIVHSNFYDYSLSHIDFNGYRDKTTIVCPVHGKFKQIIHKHLGGDGCKKCKQTKRFIKRAIRKHGNRFDYELTVYEGCCKKIKIICKKHDTIFEQTPNAHLQGQGCTCCRKFHAEESTKLFMQLNNIIFIFQKKFDECKNKLPLRFDFYLPDYNLCIEIQGPQHFKSVEFFGGEEQFKKTKKNDKIKKEFCSKQNGNPDLLTIKDKDKKIYSKIIRRLNKILKSQGKPLKEFKLI